MRSDKTFNPLHSKGNYKKEKKLGNQNGKKIFANTVTDKGLISKIYKQFTQ